VGEVIQLPPLPQRQVANWRLTAPPPAAVDAAITSEHRVLRDALWAVIRKRHPTPVTIAAALFAVADIAGYLATAEKGLPA